MTWKEIKLATLQKMFASDGATIPSDEGTNDYVASMPQVANEALQRLSTAGKFLIKSISIAHNPLDNLIPDIGITKLGRYIVIADKAHSYYFQFTGKGYLFVTVNNVTTTVTLDSKGKYTEYKGLIDNDNDLEVTLEISCDYPSCVKNLALYAEKMDEADEVPPYTKEVRYDLRKLADDFYQLGDNQIVFEGDTTQYLQLSEYFRESDSVIVISRYEPGNYTVYYRAYPPQITYSTLDDYELPLDREVAVLLPLYMASELYKDDDVAIATTYRNEFEIAFESLVDTSNTSSKQEFISEGGWI